MAAELNKNSDFVPKTPEVQDALGSFLIETLSAKQLISQLQLKVHHFIHILQNCQPQIFLYLPIQLFYRVDLKMNRKGIIIQL